MTDHQGGAGPLDAAVERVIRAWKSLFSKVDFSGKLEPLHEALAHLEYDRDKAKFLALRPSLPQGSPAPDGGFCTDCGHAFPSFEGLTGCPACGTKSPPCANTEQVSISINWHELRILVIWAENWQRQKTSSKVVYSIAERIAAQHPGKMPLTLAGELGEVAEKFPGMQVSDPKLRQDIAEQTGQEPGLIQPSEDL